MRKVTIVAVFILVFGAFALAQVEPKPFVLPKTEFFLGYSYQYADTSGTYAGTANTVPVTSTNLNGFGFEFSHYLNGRLGYTIDVSRGSNSRVDSTGIKYVRDTYMAGPSYRLRRYGFISSSVHALAGVDHAVFTYPVLLFCIQLRQHRICRCRGRERGWKPVPSCWHPPGAGGLPLHEPLQQQPEFVPLYGRSCHSFLDISAGTPAGRDTRRRTGRQGEGSACAPTGAHALHWCQPQRRQGVVRHRAGSVSEVEQG